MSTQKESDKSSSYDVAIIGGGPAGSTTASMLKKYNPDLRVIVLEREVFPRDHIGESLLPPISPILDEIGAWDKIEAADFPIKIGATYRWGRTPELWNFDFIPPKKFVNEPRPAKFEGQRIATAFQVDRSIYDKVLLDHSAEMGCEVRQGTKVVKVEREGDSVTGLKLENGETIHARHYVDASGNSGILRRTMDIACEYPTTLQNIAIYDYWQNADWLVEIGVGGTRIQVLTLPYGWLWFIPVGPTRTSIGLVVPVEYYKSAGKKPEELYRQALKDDSIVAGLLVNATCEGHLTTTKDWSFSSERHTGENWYLVGECSGFADPILSAGVTMAHQGARQLAFTILEIDRGNTDAAWLKDQFERRQKQRILTHIRFGDYWYTANAQLTNLKEFTAQLASDVGLELTPEKAWDWIARGGFIDEDLSLGYGGFGLRQLRSSGRFLLDVPAESPLDKNNVMRLDLKGAVEKDSAFYSEGRVDRATCYVRNNRVLPMWGPFRPLVEILKSERELPRIAQTIEGIKAKHANNPAALALFSDWTEVLEGLISDGWVAASYNPKIPLQWLRVGEAPGIRWNKEVRKNSEPTQPG